MEGHRTSLPENATIDVERARADTPAVADLDCFYSCGAGFMPRQVLDALHGHLDREARIGGYAAEDEARPRLEATHASIARLLNCSPEEIALVENATVAWRQACYGLAQDMERGDNIFESRNLPPLCRAAMRPASVATHGRITRGGR